MAQIEPGKVVPISAQLFDNNENAKVSVRVMIPDGTAVLDASLQSKQNGLYVFDGFLMPDEPFIICQYIVDGKSLEGEEYEIGQDVFLRDDSLGADQFIEIINERLPDKSDYFVGKIIEEAGDDFMEGVIQ